MAPPRFQIILSASSGRDGMNQTGNSSHSTTATWRLLGSNHRELGRSAESFDDVEECRRAIRHLQAAMPRIDSQVLAHPTMGSWFWRIHLDTSTVAVSSRMYQRRRESAQSLSRTLESIPLIDREPVILRLRGGTSHENRRALTGPSKSLKIIDLRDSASRLALRSQPKTGNQA